VHRRAFMRVAGGGVVLSALGPFSGCSTKIPGDAIAAWQGPGDEPDVRKWILSYAILAPHSHNLQSWRVDLSRPDEITLYCDPSRLLPETDPLWRQIMVSQGTFLELLDLAAKGRGLRTEIDLFPEGEFVRQPDPRPTARIRLSADSVEKDPLFAQILRRRTNRELYTSAPVPHAAIERIAASVAGYPVRVGFIDATAKDSAEQLGTHRRIAKEAWRIELTTRRTALESYKVLRVGPKEISQHRDGITVNNFGARMAVSLGFFDRTQPPGPGDSAVADQIQQFDAKIDSTPAFFWLTTEGNDRKTQVIAGRAYVRAQLAATAEGLSMHPLSQALQEYPEMAKSYAEIHTLLKAPTPTSTVQMWTRLGFGPPIQPAPRRGLAAHLIATASV
jgi:hypothetical protein